MGTFTANSLLDVGQFSASKSVHLGTYRPFQGWGCEGGGVGALVNAKQDIFEQSFFFQKLHRSSHEATLKLYPV